MYVIHFILLYIYLYNNMFNKTINNYLNNFELSKINNEYIKINDKCPLCKHLEKNIWSHDKNINNLIVYQCNKCELVYINRILKNEYINKYYNNYGEQLHNLSENNSNENNNSISETDISGDLLLNTKDDNNKRLKQYMLDFKFIKNNIDTNNKFIFDYACSNGKFLSYFENDCVKYGYDACSKSIQNAKITYPTHTFSDKLINLDNKIDIFIIRGSIMYIRDLDEFYNYLNKTLKIGGYLIILCTTNSDSPCFQLQREFANQFCKYHHINVFNINSLNYYLKNFKLIHKDFPYMDTPYENYIEDKNKFNYILKTKDYDKYKFPYFGNMMNLIYKKF